MKALAIIVEEEIMRSVDVMLLNASRSTIIRHRFLPIELSSFPGNIFSVD